MKDQLVYDTTDATSIAHSDKVGAFVLDAAGNEIESQSINSERWLNTASILHDDAGAVISDANPLAVSVKDGVNVEVDLSHIDDSVRLGDGTSFFTSTSENGDIALDVHISNTEIAVTQGSDSPWSIDDGGGSITVDASDLDIRDLSHTQDSIRIGDGTELANVNASNELNVRDDDANTSLTALAGTVAGSELQVDIVSAPVISVDDNGGSLTVDAVDLDIRDLSAAQDSVESWMHDGAGTALTSTLVGADQALDVNIVNSLTVGDAALADSAIAAAANTLAVADTAEDVVASPLASRKYLFIRNMGKRRIFIGQSGVSAASGFPLSPQSILELRAGPSIDIEFVGASGQTPEIRTLELS